MRRTAYHLLVLDEVSIGDELAVRLDEESSPRTWQAISDDLPPDWDITMNSRQERLLEKGDVVDCWVYGADPAGRHLWVSDSDFGRLPISDRMRPKYLRALQVGVKILADASISVDSLEDLSELKGMFSRIRRRDQWDWFSVSVLLGHPPRPLVDRVASTLPLIRAAVKGGDTESLPRLIQRLDPPLLDSRLRRAITELQRNTPKLSLAVRFTTSDTLAVDQPPITETTNEYIVSQVARVKLERANSAHKSALAILASHLSDQGVVVERSILIDAFAILPTGPAVFEVKSNTATNERSQVRHAVSQLYEYRYLHNVAGASLWLVLSAPAYAAWIVDYLRQDRGINVLWVDDGRLAGPNLDDLMRSR
jgi:hypothetical protein